MNNLTKQVIMYFVVIVLAVIVLTVIIVSLVKNTQKITCNIFISQKDAQVKFLSNKTKYSKLDGDNDGVACETLK